MKPRPWILRVALATAFLPSCGGGSSPGGPPPAVPDEPRILTPLQDAPGIVVSILGLDGSSGRGGFFLPGDRVRVRYTLAKKDGSRWNLREMDFGRILVSGPSFNYQRVIAERADLAARSVQQHDGSYVYTFADPLPATYLPPLNDTTLIGPDDGEKTGQDLLDGTYTVGMALAWQYSVSSRRFVDAGNATADFRLGDSAILAHREAVNQESCDRCHVGLRYHDDHWRDVTTCVLCHTSGAEDSNDPAVAGGTPGVSIDFRVLVHKLHNGRHLPSVLGVTTAPSGRRDYTALPQPYVVASTDGTLHDYSAAGFPVWPNRTIPMFRDRGWSDLPPEAQAIEDVIRTGVSDCSVCHGTPDPACGGPAPGDPTQGGLAYSEPSIRACASCHDDIVWEYPYISNQPPVGMEPQKDSAHCRNCHSPSDTHCASGGIAVAGAHRHPLRDPTTGVPPGQDNRLELEIVSLSEAGVHDGDGRIDPGERIEIVLAMRDGTGAPLTADQVAAVSAVVSGPTSNANQLLDVAIPKALLAGPQPFNLRLPELRQLELVGRSTAATGDVFTTSTAPHVDAAGAATIVRVRTATAGGATVLATSASRPRNFVDVVDATGFARDDYVVVDDGTASEEYARIQLVDGSRLWFSSPSTPAYPSGLSLSHAAGAAVEEVTLVTKVANEDYALDGATGTLTELVELGAGNAVLVTYTTEFTMPRSYPLALNASPDLDETTGKWTGKDLAPGTYTLLVSGYRDLTVVYNSERNSLKSVSSPATRDFLVGDATAIEPYALIDSPSSCYRCHTDIWFHKGRYRGFETCIACHGQAGSEDLPPYVAANAPATSGVTVNFRTLLHQIHRGSSLADASLFQVVGTGPGAYPDNFSVSSFAAIHFPPMPGATMHCTKCHGEAGSAWLAPASRDHPTEPGAPVLAWRAVCGACHATADNLAHILDKTPGGHERCATCHGPGGSDPVDRVHKTR